MGPDARSRSPHIAIIRLTSLGDVIHALPMAAAIRRHLPGARITWLVEEREQIVLRDNDAVDDVLLVPLRRWRSGLTTPSGWRRAMAGYREVSRELRSGRVDVAIDVQGWAHKSSPLTLLTRAPLRIGFDRAHARDPISPLATNRHVTPPPDARHIVDQNLSLLAPLGIADAGRVEFPMPVFADAGQRAGEWLAQQGIRADHRIAVLLPSTRGEQKRWSTSAFREVGRRLLESDPRLRLLVLGGPGEEAILDEVAAGLPADRVRAFAPGPIPDLVATIRRSHFTLGNDTGPLHVSAAAGIPSLGLFGPTRGARNGPYGAHCDYLQSPTGRIADVTVDAVWAAVVQLRARTLR
jgi:lipopolysaccharide heptosyltransferase I